MIRRPVLSFRLRIVIVIVIRQSTVEMTGTVLQKREHTPWLHFVVVVVDGILNLESFNVAFSIGNVAFFSFLLNKLHFDPYFVVFFQTK